MRNLTLKLLTSFFLALSLSACDTKKPQAPGRGQVEHKPLITPEPLSWTPQSETVSCSTGDCPQEVGALFFPTRKEDKYLIVRCTGFLISENTVMSAGHCLPSEQSEGFFVTQPIGGKSLIRRIKSTLFQEFTPGPSGPDTTAGRPDFAAFQLEEPIQEIAPGRLAQGPLESFTQLNAFVINLGSQKNELVIDKKVCQVHRDEFDFPYDLTENPDMIFAFHCDFIRGNSGAPLYAPGHPEIQAIISGGVTLEDRREQANKKSLPLETFQLKSKVITTNVRCLPWPHEPNLNCTKVTDELSRKRFTDYQNSLFASLKDRKPPQTERGLRYEGRAALLKNSDTSSPSIFEVFYNPVCRTEDLPLAPTPLSFEYVTIEFDKWARGTWKVIDQRVSPAKIQARQGDLFQMTIAWPKPLAPLDAPEIDVRHWIQPFALSIPLCSSDHS